MKRSETKSAFERERPGDDEHARRRAGERRDEGDEHVDRWREAPVEAAIPPEERGLQAHGGERAHFDVQADPGVARFAQLAAQAHSKKKPPDRRGRDGERSRRFAHVSEDYVGAERTRGGQAVPPSEERARRERRTRTRGSIRTPVPECARAGQETRAGLDGPRRLFYCRENLERRHHVCARPGLQDTPAPPAAAWPRRRMRAGSKPRRSPARSLALNVAVFSMEAALAHSLSDLPPRLALGNSARATRLATVGEMRWETLITACFLHAGVLHLAFNMLALWQAGPLVERAVGSARMAPMYMAAGVFGNALSVASGWWQHSASFTVGASGAISGVIAAALVVGWRVQGWSARSPRRWPDGWASSSPTAVYRHRTSAAAGSTTRRTWAALSPGAGIACLLAARRAVMFEDGDRRGRRRRSTAVLVGSIALVAVRDPHRSLRHLDAPRPRRFRERRRGRGPMRRRARRACGPSSVCARRWRRSRRCRKPASRAACGHDDGPLSALSPPTLFLPFVGRVSLSEEGQPWAIHAARLSAP